MQFRTAVQCILQYEGGLVNHPNDPGGVTKYGISAKAYPELGPKGVMSLTRENAEIIYKEDYWDVMKCDMLHDEVRLMVFDCAVNQGVGFATKVLQSAVGVTVDLFIGPETISASHRLDPHDLLHKIGAQRFERYALNPNWNTFKSGWMSRLLHVSVNSARGNYAKT